MDRYEPREGIQAPGGSRITLWVSVHRARNVEVFTAFCESHTSQAPFHAVSGLLRAATGVDRLDPQAARDRVRDRVPDADREDLVLFDDRAVAVGPDHSDRQRSGVVIPTEMIHYGVSKTALVALSRGFAKDAAGTGVRCHQAIGGP